jgi:replicative DNA helicase
VTDNYEALLCGALLGSPELIGTACLESKAFKDERYKTIFEVMKLLQEGEVNPATVHQELVNRGWKSDETAQLLNTLTGQEGDFDAVQFYSAKVNESYGKRSLASKLTTILRDVKTPSIPLEDNIAAVGQVAVAAQMGATLKDYTADGIFTRIFDMTQREEPPAFSSGMPLIDDALASKGIKHRQVWFVTGGYKQYKSRVVTHMCNAALSQGKSVAYFALEDDDITFSTTLMASKFGIPERAFEAYYQKQQTNRARDVENAANWLSGLGPRWRVYDQTSSAGDWKHFSSMVMADKMKYHTDLVVLDHIQMWSEDNKELSEINKMLMKVVAQADVALLIISQVSNEVLFHGSAKSMLHTKGTGSFGALVHAGIEVAKDADKSDFYLQGYPQLRAALEKSGKIKYVNKQELLSEISVRLKVVRKGNPIKTYAVFDPFSGMLLHQGTEPYVLSK